MKTSYRSSFAFTLRRTMGRRFRAGTAAAFYALVVPLVSAAGTGDDVVYYQLPLAELIRQSDAALSEPERSFGFSGRMVGVRNQADFWPHVWVEKPARVWLGSDQPVRRFGRVNLQVAVSAPRGVPVRGLLLPPGDGGDGGAARVPFVIDPDSTEPLKKDAIRPVVESHYVRLARLSPVGQPWFRLQIPDDSEEADGEAEISPGAGDAGHGEAIARLTLAVDPNSELMRMLSGWSQELGGGLGANPFRWMEGTVSLYLDDDPFWRELAESPDLDRFLQEHGMRLPAALHVESKDPIRLALFLTGLRKT